MRPLVHSRLVALVGLFVALCLAYNVATPLYEAPDERDHVDYTGWLAGGNGFPHLVADREEVGEIWQPPLYYALVAAVIAPLDRAELDSIAPLSEDWQAGLSRLAHYHTAAESFPFRGAALTVHVARLVSTALGLITVLAAYAIARLLFPDDDRARRYALVAATLVALNPQFIFMSAAVNNDNLVIALSSVALWLVVKLVTGETDEDEAARPGWGWYAVLGVVWGAAALAKLTGLTLGLVIGLALLYVAVRRRSLRPLVVGGLLTGGGMLLVCGWWFWRNWQLYGDPLAWGEMLAVTGSLVRPSLLGWPETLRYATFLRQTYWASFGYGVLAPDSFYWVVTAVMLLIAAGWAIRLLRGRGEADWPRRVALLLLAIWAATVLAFLLRWIRTIDMTNQGRLLFPAIAALGVLGAAGLAALDGRRMLISKAVTAVLGCWAAALPLLTILPAYAQPSPVAAASIPNPVDIRFGDDIRLRGYELPAVIAPGEPVPIALYWETARPIAESYIVALRVLDPAGQPASGLDTLPADGRYSTAVWPPGAPFRDAYALPPLSEAAQPGLGSLLVIIYPRGEPGAPLAVTVGDAAAGHEARIGAVKLAPFATEPVTPPITTGATLGERFRLQGYDAPATAQAGETVNIMLFWESLAPDGHDYTVFVHLVDAAGQLVAQSDGPPRGGTYPTSIWGAGEQIIDARALVLSDDLPAGRYSLLVGLYDPASGGRLAAVGADGRRYTDDAVLVIDIEVGPVG